MAREQLIQTSQLETTFRRLRASPRNNVLVNNENLLGGIPPHLVKAMVRRAQIGTGIDRVGQFRYNPFLQATNLDIPSDLRIRHQYQRHFVRTNALVGSIINLHAEYPLSGFHVEHEDEAVQEFFEDMIEETDLVDFLFMMALEWWVIGEVFPFGFLDNNETPSTWTGFLLLDPDKVLLQTSPWLRGPKKEQISLVIDNVTQKIIDNGANHPITGSIYKQLPEDILLAGRTRRPLSLSPLQVSHVKQGNAFNIRGESVIERVFPLLMYRDKLRSSQYAIADRHITPCYDENTECLTREGWKHYTQLTRQDDIATYNLAKGELEYQKPEEIYVFPHKGDLIHFRNTKRLDVLVTPHHKMLCKEFEYSHFTLARNPARVKYKRDFHYKYGDWKVIKAEEVRPKSIFKAALDRPFEGVGTYPKTMKVCGVSVPIETYLMFAGYFVSEGSISRRLDCPCKPFVLLMPQMKTSKCFTHFCAVVEALPGGWKWEDRENGCRVYRTSKPDFAVHFLSQFDTGSANKKLPQWLKDLPSQLLKIFIDALVAGDGHRCTRTKWKDKVYEQNSVYYTTISRQLANDLQDIVFRCGYAPMLTENHIRVKKNSHHSLNYDVFWTEHDDYGKELCVGSTHKTCKARIYHEGEVWCVKVPNKFFVTRRNGKISIHHNTEIFKIGESGDPADAQELEDFRELIAGTFTDVNRCFHPSHECLTREGWKHYTELTYADEVGTFNLQTNALEYQKPSQIHILQHDGELIHFTLGYNDILVTPDHRMLVDQKAKVGTFGQTAATTGRKYRQVIREFRGEWKAIAAKDVKPLSRFRAVPDRWDGILPTSGFIGIGEKQIPLDLYLRFAGYFISEGSAGQAANQKEDGAWFVTLAQMERSKCALDMSLVVEQMSKFFKFRKYLAKDNCIRWQVQNKNAKDLAEHCITHFGKYSANKKIPTWIRNLPKAYLQYFLDALVNGDGCRVYKGRRLQAVHYATTSKELGDQVQEIVFKLGRASRLYAATWDSKKYPGERYPSGKRKAGVHSPVWTVYWNEETFDDKGRFPYVGDYHTWKRDVTKTLYKGPVWCVTTPNDTVVTRRNGRISIQQNCLVTHHAVNYQVEGATGKIMPIWQEMEGIDNEICAGLMMNKSFVLGDSSTFASDVIRLEILVNRYMIFRKRLEKWLLRSVFAPICKIHEMYVPEFKVKSLQYRRMSGKGRPLALPTIKWEKQNLRDDQARTQLMVDLASRGLLPYSAVYPLLNMEPRQVNERIDQEIEDRAERQKKLNERLQKRGLAWPANPGEEGQSAAGPPGQLPTSVGGEPRASVEAALPGGPGGGLPTMVPGTEEGATAGVAGGLPGAPAISQLPTGVPTG